MKLLNLACGAVRVVDDTWTNCDNLFPVLVPGSPERENLNREANYRNCDITQTLPFEDGTFDGVLASHVIEHFDCQQGVAIMRECHRILKPGGVLLVSVPDANVFRELYFGDNTENAVSLFGEPIHPQDGETTFAGYALWNRFHKAILTEDSLWSYFIRAGFPYGTIRRQNPEEIQHMEKLAESSPFWKMAELLNRLPFSLIMAGTKL